MTNILHSILDLKIEYMIPANKEVEQAIENKFLTPSKFALEVENIVITNQCNYIDAIVMFCETNNIEIESVTKLISKTLKEKLKYDAIKLNFIKRTSNAKSLF
jgi:hypothetical protein